MLDIHCLSRTWITFYKVSYSQKHHTIQYSPSSTSSQVNHLHSTRFTLDTWMLIANPAVSHTDHWGKVKLEANWHLLVHNPWDKTLFTASWFTSSTSQNSERIATSRDETLINVLNILDLMVSMCILHVIFPSKIMLRY
jgi:hypothetical protein